MDIEELRQRAIAGQLTPLEIGLVKEHLHAPHAAAVRRMAAAVAGDYLAATSEATLMLELVRIAEDGTDEIGADAARALARATGYHGKPVEIDL